MEQIKKNFGFGCMRLPMNGENVDTAETCRIVDAFLDAGLTTSTRPAAICRARASWSCASV